MSLLLEMGTKPHGLYVKTHGNVAGLGQTVMVGDYEISFADFIVLAEYVLTNTDLMPNDPRLQFVKCVQAMQKEKGWGSGTRSRRLTSSVRALLPRHYPKKTEPPKAADKLKGVAAKIGHGRPRRHAAQGPTSTRPAQKRKSQGARRRK